MLGTRPRRSKYPKGHTGVGLELFYPYRRAPSQKIFEQPVRELVFNKLYRGVFIFT